VMQNMRRHSQKHIIIISVVELSRFQYNVNLTFIIN
jgi:hypothetical protein